MNRIRFLTALTLLAVSVCGSAAAQDKLVLTLEDSLRMALKQNPFYLANQAKEGQASAAVKEAFAGFFPTLNIQGTDVLDKKVFTIEFPSMMPGEPPTKVKFDFTRKYTLALNFSLPLYTGGRLISGYKSAQYNLDATRESDPPIPGGNRPQREEGLLRVSSGPLLRHGGRGRRRPGREALYERQEPL